LSLEHKLGGTYKPSGISNIISKVAPKINRRTDVISLIVL